MKRKFALALSGGGVRAMAFHMGVLRFLAQRQELENISDISTVSGGSLLIGLIFGKSKMRWPSSAEYLNTCQHELRKTLLGTDLQMGTLGRLIFRPSCWRYLNSRPNVVALAIYEEWRIRGIMDDLPRSPRWSINCTTAETGRRFRFKEERLGDYETGYANAGKFPLASAMAISAAFPVGIGPFRLYASRLEWWKKPYWEAPQEVRIPAPFKDLHLYDGGVYDNLGIEPFFDAGRGAPKKGIPPAIIVSDAGAPLVRGFGLSALNPLRMKRLMDVMMDQNRALRVRGFINHVETQCQGAYLGIQRSPNIRNVIKKSGCVDSWLGEAEAAFVSGYSTSLRAMSEDDFKLIEEHGYQTAVLTQLGYPYM